MTTTICHIYDSELILVRVEELCANEGLAIEPDFDCFLVSRSSNRSNIDSMIIDLLAAHTSGWVEVFGVNAEEIHDAIDKASVIAGRQKTVGDGVPMTAWYDEMDDVSIAKYILTGGQGDKAKKLLMVLGSRSDESALLNSLREERGGRKGVGEGKGSDPTLFGT